MRHLLTALVARLPLAALSIGILVHVQLATGSYAQAGAAVGACAIAQGLGGPMLGRLADRHGRRLVLLVTAVADASALAGLAVSRSFPVILLLAALAGLAIPPVGACLRTLIPVLFPGSARRAYAVDAAATEVTWVAGPPLALLLGRSALLVFAAILLVATVGFAVSGPVVAVSPRRAAAGSALAAPAMRVLVLVLAGAGVLFGATEVSITAAAGPATAGLLLGLWGAGSLAGGVVAARCGGGRGLAPMLALLGAGHAALALAGGRVILLGGLLAVAGSLIAPILGCAYAMVDAAAPAGTATEAFAWLATASAIGTSLGAASAGALADAYGPAAGFLLAGVAATAAAVLAVPRPARVAVA
jgi:MFS family permease